MVNGTVVAKMNEQKHLGPILDSSLSFKKHINEKIIKAQKNLGIIKHLSMFLPRTTLDQMYKVLVRSHLDYCDIIYHIPSVHTQFGVTLTDQFFFLHGFFFLENKVTKPWFDREIKPSSTAIPEIYNINTLI